MQTTIVLTQQLVSIPSFVDKTTNETALAVWLERYIARALPWLKTTRQYLSGTNGRFNLIATDGFPAKLVFLSHMDTVLPSSSSQLKPIIKNGKLYGRGAADMKGGLAAALIAIQNSGPTNGLTLMFDCDEEYYFKGVKNILTTPPLAPQLVVCPEPTSLKIINGCRGLVELECLVQGKSAHAGRPQLGINAITKSVEVVQKLTQTLQDKNTPELGATTVNLAYMRAGLSVNSRIKKQPNAVPDSARFTLDIRTASPALTAASISMLMPEVKSRIIIDYPAYLTPQKQLKGTEYAQRKVLGKIEYQNLSQTGFYEAALVSKAWNCPAISFGPTGPSHASDEFVTVSSLEKTTKIYQLLIKRMLK